MFSSVMVWPSTLGPGKAIINSSCHVHASGLQAPPAPPELPLRHPRALLGRPSALDAKSAALTPAGTYPATHTPLAPAAHWTRTPSRPVRSRPQTRPGCHANRQPTAPYTAQNCTLPRANAGLL